jgi:hypothetical protein
LGDEMYLIDTGRVFWVKNGRIAPGENGVFWRGFDRA